MFYGCSAIIAKNGRRGEPGGAQEGVPFGSTPGALPGFATRQAAEMLNRNRRNAARVKTVVYCGQNCLWPDIDSQINICRGMALRLP
jgi:hypothetical protein